MKALFFIILFFLAITTYSQVNDKSDEIIDPIEQWPLYPGGLDSLWCFLETNFNYEVLNVAHDPTKYVIHFYIDTLGQAKGFELLTTLPRKMPIDSLITSEIYRVMKLMPKWEPASQMGIKVSCWFTLPIPTPYIDYKCRRLFDLNGTKKDNKK
jgi:hypothetical protein